VPVLANSTIASILAGLGLLAGLGIAVLVVGLFNGIVRPLRKISSYADDVLSSGVGIAKNLDGIEQLGRTDELTGELPGLTRGYLERLRAG
jgi:hypothetical protein